MIGNLIAPVLSAAMMEKTGPWPVLFLALGVTGLSAVIMLFVPETKRAKQAQAEAISPTLVDLSGATGAKARVMHLVSRAKESLSIFKSWNVVLFFAVSLALSPVVFSTLQFMVQFSSKRYGVSLSQTGYLLSVYGFANLIAILFLLPAAAKHLRTESTPRPFFQADDRKRDLLLARLSALFYGLGALLMALAPTIPPFIGGLIVLAVGSGASGLLKSLCAVYVDEEHTTRLYTMYSIADTVGSVFVQPMLAGLFALGMKLGGTWIGLPYLAVVGGCVLAVVLLAFVRLPQRPLDEGHESGDEHEETG
jgi:MFS family permease